MIGVHHRAVAQILGVIGYALEGPELGFGDIPLIQLLVVNKKTGVPGDSGLRWLIKDDEQRAKLSLEARKALRDGVREQIFGWQRWREVLVAFGLEPLELSALPLQEIVKASRRRRRTGARAEII